MNEVQHEYQHKNILFPHFSSSKQYHAEMIQ